MMELLAPAGGYEALTAAVQNGADAVYMGFGAFNARRSAKNFTDEEFASAVRYCHLRGVRVFLTLNTLLTDRELVQAGVKGYEYSKGFLHSKTFVSDDRTATVGTTNLDFRSLYLHYECGALLYEAKAVMEVKEDFLQTLEICQQVTEKDCKTNIVVHLLQDILRLFAPLM